MLSIVILKYSMFGLPLSAASSFTLAGTAARSLSLAVQKASKSSGRGSAGWIFSGETSAPPRALSCLSFSFTLTSASSQPGASSLASMTPLPPLKAAFPLLISASPPFFKTNVASAASPSFNCTLQRIVSPG